jgi:clan AA aspartic protease
MGRVYAEIELINSGDIEMARRGNMDIDEIKRIRINALADSGAYMMAINENIQEILQLPFLEKKKLSLASGEVVSYDVVGPIDIRFKNRSTSCRAIILPGDAEPLLGAIPMEDMDVIIHPLRQELMGNPAHGESGMWKL